jgi:hypothetical protein
VYFLVSHMCAVVGRAEYIQNTLSLCEVNPLKPSG